MQNRDLEAFRIQYQKINQALRSGYEGEKKMIRKCKELISQIFDKAQNYRAALRIATNEVEKIDSLKREKDRCMDLQAQEIEEEKLQKEEIGQLNKQLDDLREQAMHTGDLPEVQELAEESTKLEDMDKMKSEQDERLASQQAELAELEEEERKFLAEIEAQKNETDDVRQKILDTRTKKHTKEEEKTELEHNKGVLQREKTKAIEVKEEKKITLDDAVKMVDESVEEIKLVEFQVQKSNENKHTMRIAKDKNEKELAHLEKSVNAESTKLYERQEKHERVAQDVGVVDIQVHNLSKKLAHTEKIAIERKRERDELVIQQ